MLFNTIVESNRTYSMLQNTCQETQLVYEMLCDYDIFGCVLFQEKVVLHPKRRNSLLIQVPS